ncbi:hypothetical protein GGX14DRAFT_366088 [Mycena pura]|uniref:Helitron helicase-like domain-containing protein n=1 Tax=Mycena pura TaxID=153505 RepID=A0AAD6VES1_9AGAR|nr:hypothetical protein GGX14DRAFT_366088 [Mycena pura]
MKAFVSALLGYNPEHKDLEGGILGVVKAYYGCVEAQGRGTLHCHMLVWIEGGLNPNEIKRRVLDADDSNVEFGKRLLAFLDDTISNSIPPDPDPNIAVPSDTHHPCSTRGIPIDDELFSTERQKDLRNIVLQCQSHSHSKTCFKYWKGPPEPKTCRFDLHEDNFRAVSCFDPETGEIKLRCLDGLVNNFNSTIIEAVRNNMDIKFVGSGASAKGILYYITDYITKSQLKTHVAFAMLELAVKKLGHFNPHEDDMTTRAKKLLQKCAYAMISQQELSAQQVASYLLDFEDHFTSHSFRNFYWTSFENFINKDEPSPECYKIQPSDESEGEDDLQPEPFLNDLIDVSDDAEITENGEGNEEIRVAFDGSGNLVRMGNQLSDYQKRGNGLDNLTVWDFISRVDKVSKSSDRRSHKSTDENMDDHIEPMEIFDDDAAEDDELEDDSNAESMMDSETRQRPRVPFLQGHDQQKTPVCEFVSQMIV